MMAKIIDTLSKPDILALIFFTFLFGMSIAIYGIYMIRGLNSHRKAKNGEEKKNEKKPIETPDDKTYRFGFLLVIIITLALLAFGLKRDLDPGVVAQIGTVAGYVLGGYRVEPSKKAKPEQFADDASGISKAES